MLIRIGGALALLVLMAPAYGGITVDITDLGGIADGTTDNAPAFQRAMERLAHAGGGRLRFPPAPLPYVVAETLVVDLHHVEILGDGATLQLAGGASDGRQTHVLHVRGTEDRPLHHVTVRGLTIDANYWEQDDAARPRGVQIDWARQVLVDRVRIVRPWVGLTFGRGAIDCEARDCEVNLWHNDAYSVDGAGVTGGTRRIRLIRCRAVGSLDEAHGGLSGRRDNAFEIEDGCQDVELIECLAATAGGTAFGIRNHAQPRPVETRGVVLRRCSVRDVPNALRAAARGGDNRVGDLRLIDCDMPADVRFHAVDDVHIAGGRFGIMSFTYPAAARDDAATTPHVLLQDAFVRRLRADLPPGAELRVERVTVVEAAEFDEKRAAIIDSRIPPNPAAER